MSGGKKTWQSRFEEPKARPNLHIFPPPSIPPTARIIPPLPAEEIVTALLSRGFPDSRVEGLIASVSGSQVLDSIPNYYQKM